MRVWWVDEGQVHDVFDVVEITDTLVRARTPYLFEIGEEMKLRIERDGATTEVLARVRGHVGKDDRITELELGETAA